MGVESSTCLADAGVEVRYLVGEQRWTEGVRDVGGSLTPVESPNYADSAVH